jgi:polysaccharide transporter, PST family
MISKRLAGALRHPISQNVVALYGLQIATFVIPLVTLPYISRVLGPSGFGLVVLSQGFSVILTLVIDWGFTPWGARAVAADRERETALARTVALVRSAQLLMVAASLPVAIGALVIIPTFNQNHLLLWLAWVAALATALTPNWYFVGMERVRLVSALQVAFRTLGAALTFVLVDDADDASIVLALYAASSLGTWLGSDVLLYRRVPMRLTGLRSAAAAVRDSRHLFLGTLGGALYSSFNVVLLGLFVPAAQVAHFGASERIVRASGLVLSPIGTAVLPRLAFLQASGKRERARQLLLIAAAVGGFVSVCLAVVFAVFAPLLIRIVFGHDFVDESVPILRILVLSMPVGIVGGVMAAWLMSLHMDRTIVRIVIGTGLVNVAIGCILTPLFGPQGMAWAVVVAQLAGTLGATAAVYLTERSSEVPLMSRRRHARAKANPEPGGG